MRVLHVGKYYPPFFGGIENFMRDLLQVQAEADLEVEAIVHHHVGFKALSDESAGGVHLVRVPIYGRLLFTPISPAFPRVLNRLIRDRRPDIITVHMPNVSAFWLLALKSIKNIPIVIHWHSDVISSSHQAGLRIAYRFYRPWEQRLLRAASAVIVTSPNYLQTSEPLRPWPNKCHVIPLGLADTLPQINQPQELPWSPASSLKVLCIGRLTYYKGHQYLIEAASSVDKVQIIIVGKGDQEKRLRSLIQFRGVESQVQLYGEADQVTLEALLQSCDCLCLPSIERTEAFGLVILEAMRAGKPVIATDVRGSGMSWVVQHDKTGLLARHADVGSLRECLEKLRLNPGLRTELGAKAQRRFQETFTIDRVCENTTVLYKQIIEA